MDCATPDEAEASCHNQPEGWFHDQGSKARTTAHGGGIKIALLG
jgi:hypothetical protein